MLFLCLFWCFWVHCAFVFLFLCMQFVFSVFVCVGGGKIQCFCVGGGKYRVICLFWSLVCLSVFVHVSFFFIILFVYILVLFLCLFWCFWVHCAFVFLLVYVICVFCFCVCGWRENTMFLRGWWKISCDMFVLISRFVCLLLHVISVHFSVVSVFVLVLLGVLFVSFFLMFLWVCVFACVYVICVFCFCVGGWRKCCVWVTESTCSFLWYSCFGCVAFCFGLYDGHVLLFWVCTWAQNQYPVPQTLFALSWAHGPNVQVLFWVRFGSEL